MAFDLLPLLESTGALLSGHFVLRSGRHSDRYIEKFRLLERPAALDAAAQAIADHVDADQVSVVLGAATGGILLAGAVARLLERRIMFAERVAGALTLRRGFRLDPADQVVIVEDIVTTGGSVVALMELVRQSGARINQVACLVDRSAAGVDFGGLGKALLRLPGPLWPPDECPLCKAGTPLMTPGSQGVETAPR